MSIVQRARPEIQALHAYEAAEQVTDSVRLNANESPHDNEIGQFRRPLNRYPEVRPSGLQTALAERFDCHPDQLLVTRGSSEAIDLVIRAFCRSGVDNIVIPEPSFSMYRHYAKIQGAAVKRITTDADEQFKLDVDAMLHTCDDNTRVVFVCSPNNPTGRSIPRTDLLQLVKGCDDKAVVVVDEAYIEFSDEPSIINALQDFPNLLVLRTLSKALGFAGARCGAVVGSSEVLGLLAAIQAPYALATPVVECVEDVLASDQLERADGRLRETKIARDALIHSLSGYSFVTKVWPSDANFFLVQATQADEIIARCAANNILLRRTSGDLSDCIRISVGSSTDNQSLLTVLDTIESERNV